MSFLGSLFGSSETGVKLVSDITDAVDKMFHTDQEKAEAVAQARREGYSVYMEWLKSTSGSRVARRLLALTVTGIWAIEHLSSVVLGVISVFVQDGKKLTEASEMLAGHAHDNNALVGVVLLFYFGGPAAIDGVKGLVGKWAGSNPATIKGAQK